MEEKIKAIFDKYEYDPARNYDSQDRVIHCDDFDVIIKEIVNILSGEIVKRERLIDFAKWFNNNDVIKPTSFILTDDIDIYLNQLND